MKKAFTSFKSYISMIKTYFAYNHYTENSDYKFRRTARYLLSLSIFSSFLFRKIKWRSLPRSPELRSMYTESYLFRLYTPGVYIHAIARGDDRKKIAQAKKRTAGESIYTHEQDKREYSVFRARVYTSRFVV